MKELFKKKTAAGKKPKVEMASAPENPETPGETKYIKELDSNNNTASNIEVREIPVCLSKEQINNMIIENNIMLKELVSIANE